MPDPPHRRPSRSVRRPPLPDDLTTVAEMSAAGWTEAQRRHALARGDLERVRRGVLGPARTVGTDSIARRHAEAQNLYVARAGALQCRRALVSHFAAAVAFGLPTYGPIGRPCLTAPAGTALRSLAHLHLHRATLLDEDRAEVHGLPVTAVSRTVLDIAREHGVAAAVVAADCALHRGLLDDSALRAAYERCAGWPGRRAARITLALADGRAESPLESLSRLRLAAGGVPAPRPQVQICDERGRFIGRVDFYWDEVGVVGEADGDQKYDVGRAAIVAERRREQDLTDTGLLVVRWGWADLHRFDAVARRLRTAFARGAPAGSAARRWRILRSDSALHP